MIALTDYNKNVQKVKMAYHWLIEIMACKIVHNSGITCQKYLLLIDKKAAIFKSPAEQKTMIENPESFIPNIQINAEGKCFSHNKCLYIR